LDDLRQRLSAADIQSIKPRHWLVDSWWFNAIVSTVVVINTLQIGLAVDIKHGDWQSTWNSVDIVFAILFGLEMTVKIACMRLEYFKEYWNLLDFFLAWLAMIEVIVTAASSGNAGMAGKLTILRILRLFRLLRILRLFHMFKELVILMEVMVDSLRTLAWLLVLVGLVLYVTAIVCVELLGSDSSYPSYSVESSDLQSLTVGFNNFQYFGTIIRSMYSLFSLITLSEWSTITRPVAERQPIFLLVLVGFTMLTAYGVMNVLVGVMVEHALKANADFSALRASEHKENQMGMIMKAASMLFSHAQEKTGVATITQESLQDAICSNNTLADILTRIDLPSNCSMKELFVLIDDDGDGRITQDEFETGMYRLLYCGEFQRSCIQQMSLNTLKQRLVVIQAGLEDIRQGNRERVAGDSSQTLDQPGHDRCARPDMQEHGSKADLSARVAITDEFQKLRTDLQEMKLELGARLAELGPQWQPLQPTKRRAAAPAMPHVGSVQFEIDESTVANDDASMPAVVPGLPLRPMPGFSDGGAADSQRASKAAMLMRQLDDFVGGLEQHRFEQELVRLRCADLIARLAQAMAAGGSAAPGSSHGGMPCATWDTPDGAPLVHSAWAMDSCFGKNRRPEPVRKL